MSGNTTRRRTAANVARAMRNARVAPSNLTVRAVAPNAPKRRTAANLAREIMPGPRLLARRPPTVPRFTLRRPQPTVAPRPNRKNTNKNNGKARVRRTASNIAKQIQDLPGLQERLQGLIIENEELIQELTDIYTNNPTNELRNTLFILQCVGIDLKENYRIASEFELKTHGSHEFTEEEMRVLMGTAPQPDPTEEMRSLMGNAPTEEQLRLAGMATRNRPPLVLKNEERKLAGLPPV